MAVFTFAFFKIPNMESFLGLEAGLEAGLEGLSIQQSVHTYDMT